MSDWNRYRTCTAEQVDHPAGKNMFGMLCRKDSTSLGHCRLVTSFKTPLRDMFSSSYPFKSDKCLMLNPNMLAIHPLASHRQGSYAEENAIECKHVCKLQARVSCWRKSNVMKTCLQPSFLPHKLWVTTSQARQAWMSLTSTCTKHTH